jgi:chorismate mutase / prephenate dehydratase
MMPRSASIDAPPALAASADEAPPPQDGWPGGLPALRAELDRIDDALHALLMERARVVEQVAKSGKRGAYRPGREASIIRRLLRRHSGGLPAQAIVRIWRELLAGTTAMQGAFAVAVCEPGDGAVFTQAAREHFGALTSLHVLGSASQAMSEVRRGAAAVAVLPMPSQTDTWWTALLKGSEPRVHVVARLPFWAARPDGSAAVQALVIAAVEPDPSESDRSLLGLELGPDVSRPGLAAALTAAGFAPGMMLLCRDQGASAVHVLAEVDGFVTDDDARLARLNGVQRRQVVLGAYAIPETGGAA